MSEQEIQALLEQAPTTEPQPPRPIAPPLQEGFAFPLDALPKVLKQAVVAIQQKTQAPLALAGQSVLGASSCVAQAYVNAQGVSGQFYPCSLFMLSIGASGERKTACDKLALQAIKERESNNYLSYTKEVLRYKNEKEAYESARKLATKPKKGDKNPTKESIQKAIEAVGTPPEEPIEPAILCPEPTFPALVRALAKGQPAMSIFSDEGGTFLGGFAMNKDNQTRTITGLSSLWNGSQLVHKRIEGGELRLKHKRLAVHLMLQPELSQGFVHNSLFKGQGILARFLMAYPSSTMGYRLYQQAPASANTDLEAYNKRLLHLLNRPWPQSPFGERELEPHNLALTPEAKKSLIAFYNEIEVQLKPEGRLTVVKGMANKLAEQVVRIAGVLTYINTPDEKALAEKAIKAGIILARYYLAEALRLYTADELSEEQKNALSLLDWLRNKWPHMVVSMAVIENRGPNALRKKHVAEPTVANLIEHGWLIPTTEAFTIDGKVRRDCLRLHPDVKRVGA